MASRKDLRTQIDLFGDKDLVKMFKRMPDAANRKVVRVQVKKTATRLRNAASVKVGSLFSGEGKLQQGLRVSKITPDKRSRTGVSFAVPMPSRAELGISSSDPGYYPYSLEYGVHNGPAAPQPPRSYLRVTVDERATTELPLIISGIKAGIIKEAARLAGKARKFR